MAILCKGSLAVPTVKMCGTTPNSFMLYRHSLMLHKVLNDDDMGNEWLDMNVNQTFNQRREMFHAVEMNKYKIGRNLISNRFKILNNLVELASLNDSYNQFKIKMKKKFIQNL